MPIDALVESVLIARGAILHLVLQQEVQRVVLNPTVQFAFVIWRHLNGEEGDDEE